MPVAEKMTADEFMQLLATHGRHRRMELIDGEVVVNEPGAGHNLIQMNVVLALGGWSRGERGRGRVYLPMDVGIDAHNVLQPDLLWYAEKRAPHHDSPPPYKIPDLAVEVRSPSTWRYDLGVKKTAYEARGLPELWLVDTLARTVLVYRRSQPGERTFDVALELAQGEELASPLLSGLALAVSKLFELP